MAQKAIFQRHNEVSIKGRAQGGTDAEKDFPWVLLSEDQIHSREPDCSFNLQAEISLMEED